MMRGRGEKKSQYKACRRQIASSIKRNICGIGNNGWEMKDAWYVVKTNYVLPEAEKELIENMIFSHSEKLTISFVLISASPGIPLYVGVIYSCNKWTLFQATNLMRIWQKFHAWAYLYNVLGSMHMGEQCLYIWVFLNSEFIQVIKVSVEVLD